MFFINDEKLDLQKAANSDNLIAKQIAEEISRLQISLAKKPMRIKWRDGIMTLNRKSRLKEGKKMAFSPFTVQVNNAQGTNKVTYCDQALKGDFGTIKYTPKGHAFRGTMVLGINDLELAVYYKLFSPFVKSRTIVIEDREAEARERTEARQKIASYHFYLYNEASPLYDDEDKLGQIAKAFGVQNTTTMSLDVLKDEIFRAVELRESLNKDGIITLQRFIDGGDQLLKPLADIQTLFDDGQLVLDRNKYSWTFKDGSSFFQLNPTEAFDLAVAKNKLAMYITSDKIAYDTVTAMIQGIAPAREIPKVDANTDFEMMEWADLKIVAKEHGIKTHGKQKAQIIEELKKKF